MTKAVQVRNTVDYFSWIRRLVRSQKGPKSENTWKVELRGLPDIGGSTGSSLFRVKYRADEIQNDNINILRYLIKCSHSSWENTDFLKELALQLNDLSEDKEIHRIPYKESYQLLVILISGYSRAGKEKTKNDNFLMIIILWTMYMDLDFKSRVLNISVLFCHRLSLCLLALGNFNYSKKNKKIDNLKIYKTRLVKLKVLS